MFLDVSSPTFVLSLKHRVVFFFSPFPAILPHLLLFFFRYKLNAGFGGLPGAGISFALRKSSFTLPTSNLG